MGLILVGSQTSPFVRRIRMAMENIPYEFKEINIYEKQGADFLKTINPLNQIPVLLDETQAIWDSRIIFNYLNSKYNIQKLSWKDENHLTAIEGALDAGIALFLMKKSEIDLDKPYLIADRYKLRIQSVMNYLNSLLSNQEFKNWNFVSQSLYSFLDWANFREIISLSDYPDFNLFLNHHSEQKMVIRTQIPRG